MRNCLLATAAVVALASPALAEDSTASPVMGHTVFTQTDPKTLAEMSRDECKNYAVNVFNKIGAHDLDIEDHTVFATVDLNGRGYLGSVRCQVNPKYAVMFLSVAGADKNDADQVLGKLADTWSGKNDKPKTPDVTAAVKTKKRRI